MVSLWIDFYYYFLPADAVVSQEIQTLCHPFFERALVQQQHFAWLQEVQVKQPR